MNTNDLWPTTASWPQGKKSMQCCCQVDTAQLLFPNWGCWANDQFHTLPQEAKLFIQITLFLYTFAFKICFHLFAWLPKWKPPLALFSIYTLNFSTQQNVALHCFHKNLVNNPQLMIWCIISLRWNNTIGLTNILYKCPPLSTRGKSA